MSRRALVTRPRQDAAATIGALSRRGFEVLLEPMLEIVHLPKTEVVLTGVQAILATSANGIRAYSHAVGDRNLPVLAVGEASARAARSLGFDRVEAAGGDVASLARLVRRRLDPGNGILLHVAASVVAGDLKGLLEESGFQVRRVILYEARTAERLSDEAREAIASGALDAALFYSPRTAATFATLVADAGVAEGCAATTAYCLSEAVAREVGRLPWRRVRVAARPRQDALMALIDEDFGRVPQGLNGKVPND